MADPEHLAKLNEGTGAWNKWREKFFWAVLVLGGGVDELVCGQGDRYSLREGRKALEEAK